MEDLTLKHSESALSEFCNPIIAPIPTKSCVFIPKYQPAQGTSENVSLKKKYAKELSGFSLTFQAEVMIVRVVRASNGFKGFQAYPLVKIFKDLCYELMMSEVEIAGFSVYLKRFVWPSHCRSLLILLYIVGFATKLQFSGGLDMVLAHIIEKIPFFLDFLNSWIGKNEEMIKIDLGEVNSEFNELTRKPFDNVAVGVNFYVDYILEIAPASGYEKKWWHAEFGAQEEEYPAPDLPGIIKLDSIFCEKLPSFQVSLSTGSHQSAFNYVLDLSEI